MAYLGVKHVVPAQLLWIMYEEENGENKALLVVPDGKGYIILKEEVGGRRILSRVSQQLARNIDVTRGVPTGAPAAAASPAKQAEVAAKTGVVGGVEQL